MIDRVEIAIFVITVPEAKEMKNSMPPPVPPRTSHSHHVTTTYITQDEVTISTSSCVSSSGATSSASNEGVQISVVNDPKKKNEILKLREMLLTDNSVESS